MKKDTMIYLLECAVLAIAAAGMFFYMGMCIALA